MYTYTYIEYGDGTEKKKIFIQYILKIKYAIPHVKRHEIFFSKQFPINAYFSKNYIIYFVNDIGLTCNIIFSIQLVFCKCKNRFFTYFKSFIYYVYII